MYALTVEENEKRSTFVIDFAVKLPALFAVITFSISAAYVERWSNCSTPQLKTVMKHYVDGTKDTSTEKNIQTVKSTVHIFKHAGFNENMRVGYGLIQETSEGLDKTFYMFEMFLTSESHVPIVLQWMAGN